MCHRPATGRNILGRQETVMISESEYICMVVPELCSSDSRDCFPDG